MPMDAPCAHLFIYRWIYCGDGKVNANTQSTEPTNQPSSQPAQYSQLASSLGSQPMFSYKLSFGL